MKTGQRIQIDVKDLSLREKNEDCEDYIEIREERQQVMEEQGTGEKLLSLCGDLDRPFSVETRSSRLQVFS